MKPCRLLRLRTGRSFGYISRFPAHTSRRPSDGALVGQQVRILVSGAAAACSRSDVAVVVELDDIAEILRQQVGDAERDVVVAEFGDLRHCQRVRYDSAFRFVLYRDGFSREVVGPRGFEHHRVFALGVGRELADVRAVVEQRAFGAVRVIFPTASPSVAVPLSAGSEKFRRV